MRVSRPRACSERSRVTAPAPSEITKPARSRSNGRESRSGWSLSPTRARMLMKPATITGTIAASVPPAIMASASPRRTVSNASPMAWPPVAQADTTAMFGPIAPRMIARMPLAESVRKWGRKNGLTRSGPLSTRIRSCSSRRWTPPPPEPKMTPTWSALSGVILSPDNADQVGVIFGSGGGGVQRLLEQERIRVERGPDRVSPFFLPHFLTDSASGILAIILGAMGPNMAVVSACATGGHAIGEAFETVRRGDAEAMIAGGTEAAIVPVIVAGFINMRALVADNDHPERASRPFDRDRAGFVISEGAGAVILERLEHALGRDARIYAEVAGYGSSNDAFHMAAPRDQGKGAVQCMRMALRKSDLPPTAVDYINAHGTSTPLNDKYETAAVKEVF